MSLRSNPSARAFVIAASVVGAAFGCSRTSFEADETDAGAGTTGVTGDDGSTSSTSDSGSLVVRSADGIEGVACVGKTCKDQGVACGMSEDGCGKTVDCGGCAEGGTSCVAGKCTCTPKTCADLPNVQCGYVSDGCGGNIACGACATGHCNANICTSSTCQIAVVGPGQCGDPVTNQVPDGCSSLQDGETCGANQTCGGGGTVNQCGCTKQTCEQAGAECGASVADGCGGQLSCGECSDPPGTCNGQNHCDRCIAVTDASLGYAAECAKSETMTNAWACSCADGTCDVPDPAKDSPPSCVLLKMTGQHAVYCCASAPQ